MKNSTILIASLLFSINVFAGLKEELGKKTENYNFLHAHYQDLLATVSSNNGEVFCTKIKNSYEKLVSILNDDVALIGELRKINHPDYYEYATQLDENSASPLFSYAAYTDTCQNGDRSNIIRMKQSMEYQVMNIEYLKMIHLMWIEGFENASL